MVRGVVRNDQEIEVGFKDPPDYFDPALRVQPTGELCTAPLKEWAAVQVIQRQPCGPPSLTSRIVDDDLEAVVRSLGNFEGELKVGLTDAISRALKMATAQLNEHRAVEPRSSGKQQIEA